MSKRSVLLKALAAMPPDLARLVQGVAVSQPPGPEPWSLDDVLAHLILVETEACARMQQVVLAERPSLPPLPALAAGPKADQPPATLLARFTAVRQHTLAFLQELHPGDWQRTAVAPAGEIVTLRALVQELVAHDTHYLAQIAAMKRRPWTNNPASEWRPMEDA